MNTRQRQKIAIIGTGISGLGAASLLHAQHEITLYEKNDYIGGHSRTVEVMTKDGIVPVDTGFIVFNKRNYPLLTRLFQHCDVPFVASDMSFGASIADGWLEYSTQSPGQIFAQPQNFLRPAFWRMLADIFKFNRKAASYLNKPPSFTLGDCLNELGLGAWFQNYFLLAMGAAIWSTPVAEMLKFPACSFIRFFDNHGLLTVHDQPQWYTVKGGSREYVTRVTRAFKDRIWLNCGAVAVRRVAEGVIINDSRGGTMTYDQVVFACHADQALALIENPTPAEKLILSAFQYQPNRAVLHSDTSFMPQRKKAWASWVYHCQGKADAGQSVSLSYWMNNLQPLATDQPLIVTLNPGREPDRRLVHNDYVFEHPVFNAAAVSNQSAIEAIQGCDRLWFCGAYQRYGFHEDGLGSAVKMVERMGIYPQW
ncbi:MAG: NAD(P)-binding protein [Alphaproteobacteria bacterium]|nr:NAD(P)-binding protein [Alphaproteobacteria bacterium]